MRWNNPQADEYQRLLAQRNDQRRGLDFQALMARVLELDHFDVVQNAGAARPRQTDLFATKGRDHYLIETKWRRRKVADVGDIDSLLSRLERTEGAAIGVFISHSGFSRPAVELVASRRDRPILPIARKDIEGLIEGRVDPSTLLRRKHHELRTHGRVILDEAPLPGTSSSGTRPGLPAADAEIVLPDGSRVPWIGAAGDFSKFVFTEKLPDVDWVPAAGHGVVVDFSLEESRRGGTDAVFEVLNAIGWLTRSGRWSIQQATRNWHGMGAASLADALREWESRYEGNDRIHHTEQMCYQDSAEGGYYTLTADLSAGEDRLLWHCDISLQLIGVPLDPEPIRQLAERLNADRPCYFRPLDRHSVNSGTFTDQEIEPLEPLALVVETDDQEDARTREWVTGVILSNPFYGVRTRKRAAAIDEDWFWPISESEILICALRNHHPLSEPRDHYVLRRYEWSWTSDALVFRPIADWDNHRGADMTLEDQQESLTPTEGGHRAHGP